MATLRYSIPGIGGSLGACAVCGEAFTAELILGKSVPSISSPLFGDKALPVHETCRETVVALSGPWSEIRDKFPDGPMKRCLDEAQNEAQTA